MRAAVVAAALAAALLIGGRLDSASSLTVTPVRAAVTYFNPRYVQWLRHRVQRYGRHSPYYCHLEGHLTRAWNNNITVHVHFMQLLHNEYRPTFVEGGGPLCDMFNDRFYGRFWRSGGARCPLPAGEFHLMNMTASVPDFPNVWPFEHGRVDSKWSLTATGELVASLSMEATFRNTDAGLNNTDTPITTFLKLP